MNRSAAHTALVKAVLADLGAMPGIIIAVNESGRARYLNEKTGKDFYVPYGFPTPEGGPDLLAIVAPLGRLVGLEIKTGNAVASKEQKMTHEALRMVGATVAVVRSVEEARKAIMGAMQ